MSFEKIAEKLMKLLENTEEIRLDKFELIGDKLEFEILPGIAMGAAVGAGQMIKGLAAGQKMGPAEWIETKFPKLTDPNTGKIEEVTFKRAKGTTVTIGGEVTAPYLNMFGKKNPHRPVVSLDVFDMKRSFPKPIKMVYEDVYEKTAEWGKRAEKFGADMLVFHCLATDPGLEDRPVKDDGKIYEEMLQQTKIPIIIGGSGNKKKDPMLYDELGRIAHEGNDVSMFSSADAETFEEVIPLALKYEQNVLNWTQLDINNCVKLNKDVLEMGFPRNRIVNDPTTATLGYGLEYSYSIYQRIRISGLLGDENLSFPMSGGTTNAWGAREAWMSTNKAPQWGDIFRRGPLWECTTALALSVCGLDLAMMFHPLAAQTYKSIVLDFFAETKKVLPPVEDWVTMKL